MNTKVLSPAFITSLVAIFIAALMIGASSTILTVLGWLVLLAAVGLNVVASMVSIQRAKGGPLPPVISDGARETERPHRKSESRKEQKQPEQSEPVSSYEPEEDTEAQPVVSVGSGSAEEKEEKIFRSRAPRPRQR